MSSTAHPPSPTSLSCSDFARVEDLHDAITLACAPILASNLEDADDITPLPLLQLTPTAQGTCWYSLGTAWKTLQNTMEGASRPSFEAPEQRDGLEVLYETQVKSDVSLLESMRSRSAAIRNLAIEAFCDEPGAVKSRKKGWSHTFLRCLLVDRLLWLKTSEMDQTSKDNRPPHIPHHHYNSGKFDDGLKRLEKFYRLYQDWPNTITTLRNAWNSTRADPPSSDEVDTSLSDDVRVLLSLWKAAGLAGDRGHVSAVEANFCMAAMGIRALMIVRRRKSSQRSVRTDIHTHTRHNRRHERRQQGRLPLPHSGK